MNMIASDTLFRAVYDSLASLPDRRRITSDDGIKQIEKLLGMPPKIIGAPLWVSGDRSGGDGCFR